MTTGAEGDAGVREGAAMLQIVTQRYRGLHTRVSERAEGGTIALDTIALGGLSGVGEREGVASSRWMVLTTGGDSITEES